MDNIMKLSALFGPSGDEQQVMDYIKGEIAGYFDECYIDNLGSLILRKKGKGRRICFAAFTDERGIFISHIEKDKMYFCPVGKVDPIDLVNREIILKNGGRGFVYCDKTVSEAKLQDMYLPFIEGVSVGDTGVAACGVIDGGDTLTAKALERGVCCHILMEAAKEISGNGNEIYFVFSAMYQIGKKGLNAALSAIKPDHAVVLDTLSTAKKDNSTLVSLGDGVIVKLKERAFMAKRELLDGITLPYKKYVSNETEITAKHPVTFGVLTLDIAVPMQYNNHFCQRVKYGDVEAMGEFVKNIVKSEE